MFTGSQKKTTHAASYSGPGILEPKTKETEVII